MRCSKAADDSWNGHRISRCSRGRRACGTCRSASDAGPRRFTEPLDIDKAQEIAKQWWTAKEVERVFPDDAAIQQFFDWLQEFSLGRKRLLDTLLAATYYRDGIDTVLTTNAADFDVFAVFRCITPTIFDS